MNERDGADAKAFSMFAKRLEKVYEAAQMSFRNSGPMPEEHARALRLD